MGRARFLTCVLLVLVSLLVTGSSNFVGVLLRGFNNDDVNEPPLINLQSPIYYYYNIENGVIRGVALSFWSDIVNPVVSSIFNFVYKTIHFLINTYVIFKLLQKWSSPTRCKPHHRRCRRQPHHGGGGGGGGRLIRLQHKHCDPLVRRGGKHKHTTTLLVHDQDKQSAPSLLPDDGETSLRHWTLGSSSAHDDSRVEYFDRESMTLQSATAADNSFSFPLLQSSSSTSKGGSNHPNWNSPPHLQSEIQQEEEHLIQPDLPINCDSVER